MAEVDAEKALKIINDHFARVKKLFETLKRFATQIVSTLKPVLDALKSLLSKIKSVASYLPSSVASSIKKAVAMFKKAITEIPRMIKQMQKVILQIAKLLAKGAANLIKRDIDFIKNLLQALKLGLTQFIANFIVALLTVIKPIEAGLKAIAKVESMIEMVIGDIGDITQKIAAALPLVVVIKKAQKAGKDILKYIGETEKNLKSAGPSISESMG